MTLGLLAALFLALPAHAELEIRLRLPERAADHDPAKLADARRLAVRLGGPDTAQTAPEAGLLVWTAPDWNPELSPLARQRALRALRRTWGRNLFVREPEVRVRSASQDGAAAIGEDLESQRAAYDGGRASAPGASAVAGSHGEGAVALEAPRRLRTNTPPPPARAQTAPAKRGFSWKRLGWETLKGAASTVTDMLNWKGLALAVGAVALTAVFPPAFPALLLVGAGLGGWEIGRALSRGVSSWRRGDHEGVYDAAREFGHGATTLGLSVVGARFAPKTLSFKPHVPHTFGELKGPLTTIDNVGVVAGSVGRVIASDRGPVPVAAAGR